MPVLYTADPCAGREYRWNDATGLQWFAHYGPDGGGFGYLTWRVRRRVGFDYADLGYGFPVTLYKGPFRCLFSGQITRITERSGSAGDEIEVWALGWVHAASADVYNWVYADTRYTEWRSAEKPDGLFRPDRFDWDTQERLYVKPRRGDHAAENYTYLRYTFHFGEVATRFTADYEVAFPALFPARVAVLADEAVLWSTDVSASGSLDLTTTGAPTTFEIRLSITEAGEVDAEDDTVYARFDNVAVYSENLPTLEAKTIGDDIAAWLASHGLSPATERIGATGRALLPAAFDADQTCAEVLTWACQFGDADGHPLVWGVTFDATRRLFLERWADAIRYVVDRQTANLERGGDWSESAQVVYGIYTDDAGQMRRTADVTDTALVARLGGYYRRQAVALDVTREEQALSALALWLREHGTPQLSGSFVVNGDVTTPDGRRAPFDELQPGGQVQVTEWCAVEATLAAQNFQEGVTTFPLVGVRVDYDAGTAELIPSQTSDAFTRYMAIVTQLAAGR